MTDAKYKKIPPLSAGAHTNLTEGACVMEAVAFAAGEEWSDRPTCASPVIGRFLRSWNDALPDAERDGLLRGLIPLLVNTRGSVALEQRRAVMAADWLIRVHTPAWLRLAGMTSQGSALSSLPEITDFTQCAFLIPKLNAVRADADAIRATAGAGAWATAGAGAWAAAGAAVGAAARDAARDALGAAARDAARAAAGAAARAAAGAAARAAARAAAGAAARAAEGAAARTAVGAAEGAAALDSAWVAAGAAARTAAGAAVSAAARAAAGAAARAAARDAVRAAARAAAQDAIKSTRAELQKSALGLVRRMIDARVDPMVPSLRGHAFLAEW